MKLILKRIKELIFFSKQIKDSISIPNYISKIGYSAFKNCKTLKNIKIPESVKEIGKFAFDGCSSLETLLFSSHLEKIGRCAFSNCYSIKNIVIPKSVIEIGSYAFENCYIHTHTVCVPYYKAAPYNISHTKIFQWRFSL